MPAPSTNTQTEQMRITGLRNSCSGIIGSVSSQLDPDERCEHHRRDHEQRHDTRRTPPVLGHPGQREEQRHDAASERGETRPVDAPRCRPGLHVRELEVDRGDGDGADREIHPEARAPRPLIGEPSPERRSEDRRHAPHGGEQADVPPALGRREDVADDREEQSHHHAGADTLQAAEQNQLIHPVDRNEREVAGKAAQRRRHDEQDRAEEEERLAAVDIREAREDRNRQRRRQQVRRGDPRVAIEARERGDDARLRRADDRLVDRGEQGGE